MSKINNAKLVNKINENKLSFDVQVNDRLYRVIYKLDIGVNIVEEIIDGKLHRLEMDDKIEHLEEIYVQIDIELEKMRMGASI